MDGRCVIWYSFFYEGKFGITIENIKYLHVFVLMTLFLENHPQEIIEDVQQDLSTRMFIAVLLLLVEYQNRTHISQERNGEIV